MLLSIATRHPPATDLGFLLAKHPDRLQTFDLAFGEAHVFYPHADADYCEAALLVEVDPIALVRGRGDGGGPLSQYVNDRPYVASSFLSVALSRVFGTALNGDSKSRPELAASAIALDAQVPVLRCRAGEDMIRRCFEPLGYAVDVERLPLDAQFPEWGESDYYRLKLSGTVRLSELLRHLYVLLPALDGDKHYYVGDDEVDKLVDKAAAWLPAHPEREWIALRYLKKRRSLARAALARLIDVDEDDVETAEIAREESEARIERPLSLNDQRMNAVVAALRAAGATSVLDLGCGEGRLLGRLLDDARFARIVGADVSPLVLERAAERLKLDRLAPLKRARIELVHGSLTYRDARFAGFDAACAIEVIEHIDASRLDAFERVLFEHAQPRTIVLTTPNVEYNAKFETLPAGRMRHPDHRFEWTRAEFRAWAEGAAARHGYRVEFLPVGEEDAALGPPTQMGVFTR
ncbi:3' terminal RNA ribose 2'-O-methyltransferase Hen1 [Tahibacter soli]|uniref:Small RNA 2'-O-methyltransferase n=1 Tax=Tahibacter soli TaxID=2983605 RepID=A0A9X3YJ77_9GAMM|nr:3' terminal RNA ribose 2'-O-methyltransferase Hen1 [Tahibacter soli]MDC8013374.1 3' terminal RNA ribose 2'-O-methyltransferase Hen1 [Tahibacter soli]